MRRMSVDSMDRAAGRAGGPGPSASKAALGKEVTMQRAMGRNYLGLGCTRPTFLRDISVA